MLDNQRDYWNRVADEKEFTTPFRLEIFKQFVPTSAKILDFGCGYGRTLFTLYKAGYTDATGIDISENMIGRGKSIHPYLNLFPYSGEKIPFEDGTFDALVGLAVFTCIPFDTNQQKIMQEISRVLKPGGILYLNDFLLSKDKRIITRYKKFEQKYKKYGIFELQGGGVFRHYSRESFEQLVNLFQTIILQEENFRTMNGNQTKGVFYLGKKPEKPLRNNTL